VGGGSQVRLARRDPGRAAAGAGAAVAEIERTGGPRAGSVSWDELKAELGI
jgi:hypothetical protein